MKIENFITVGDSFTFGDEVEDKNKIWPIRLSEMLKAKVVNLGHSGVGHEYCIDAIIDHTKSYDCDLVVIAWPSPGRQQWSDIHNKFTVWPGMHDIFADSPWRNELLDWMNRHHEPEYLYGKFINNLILCQGYLHSQNIPYIMMCVDANDYYHKKYSAYYTELHSKLINFDTMLEWPNKGIVQWGLEAGCKFGKGGHILEDGHQLVADKVLTHIRNNIQ